MALPALAHDYLPTLTALHQASMLMGPIHNAVLAPRRSYLHLPFWIHPFGLDSHDLPGGVELHVDFKNACVFIVRASGELSRYEFAHHTQRSLFAALLTDLRRDLLADFLSGAPDDALPETLMTKLHADPTRVEFLQLEQVTHNAPLTVNRATAADYADALNAMFTAYARFRARLVGHLTPIVVWPEHFDLSTLWFAEGDMDDNKAQMNFGFAPFSPGLDRPYLYVTSYPYAQPLTPPALPAGALWHTQGWTGVVVPYDTIIQQHEPELYVERMLRALFPIMHGLIGTP